MTSTISVDFNNLDEDGRVFARMTSASEAPREGGFVIAVDGEGNSCGATVALIAGEVVFLDLDMNTWNRPITSAPLTWWRYIPA